MIIKIKKILKRIFFRILNYQPILDSLAFVWRRLLFHTTFIAITGSVGKTTTKECIARILSAHFSTVKTKYNHNDLQGVPRTILRVKPWHRFAVIEVGSGRPGMIKKLAKLVKPDIAIVLKVARIHTYTFSTIDDIAKEKSQIFKYIPTDGFAIINADDQHVLKMKSNCSCNVKTFGCTPGTDLWAENISSKWPASLSLIANTVTQQKFIKTNLVGEHWVNSVLASLLTALLCGIDLNKDAVEIEKVKPFMGRMQPVQLPSGATLIRDEFSGSFDTLPASLKVLKDAKAARRILVISNIADSSENSRNRYRSIGKLASQISDFAIFIGKDGRYSVKTAIESGMKKENVIHFNELFSAAEYIKTEFSKGDLILLKGRSTDHLSRILFAQFGTIGCWKTKCKKRIA